MKAIVINEYGNAEQLVIKEIATPSPQQGEILIKVRAFGLNRAEILMRQGKWGEVAQVTGIECVGEVVEDRSGKLKNGQTVATIMGGMGRMRNGSYAEYTSVLASNVVCLDSKLDWVDLAAIPESYATAWSCLHDNMKISQGDTVFIRGGTSALALAAINIASNIKDVRVYAATRNSEHQAILMQAGCVRVFIESDDLNSQMREIIPEGVNSVLDLIGNSTLLDSLQMVTKGGYVCNAGFLAAAPPFMFNPPAHLPLSVNLNFFGSFHFGSALFPLSDIPMQLIVDNVATGIYHAKPAKVFKFDEIVQASQLMEDNGAMGKIVVTV